MNKGMLGVGIIVMGLIALLLVNIVSNFSSGGEMDYYLLKETTEAALKDAVDLNFETDFGLPRIQKDKFVESFLRRFAQNVDGTRNYDIKFYDIIEVPPKVSIKIDSNTVLSYNGEESKISTQLDQVIESNSVGDLYTKKILGN